MLSKQGKDTVHGELRSQRHSAEPGIRTCHCDRKGAGHTGRRWGSESFPDCGERGLMVWGSGYSSIAFNLGWWAYPKCDNRGKKWPGCLGNRVDAAASFPGCVCTQFLSHVWLCAIPRTRALQAPLSMEFSKQEHWSGSPFPPPGDLPNPGIKPTSLALPALAGRFFPTSTTWEAPFLATHSLR